MNAPQIIARPDLGKRPYRMHARFSIGAHPARDQLEKAMHYWMDRFIVDMRKKGFEYVDRPGFQFDVRVTFKGAHITPQSLSRPRRPLSSRQMLTAVMQGARFRAMDGPTVMLVPKASETDVWDYDLSAVFVHDTILTDYPAPHEELVGGRS